MSASALARRASIARRWAGVYSLSAFGTLGRIVITPPDTLISSLSPLLRPARRRTAGGTTSGVLLLTVTVIVDNTAATQFRFQCRAIPASRQTVVPEMYAGNSPGLPK